MKQYLVKLELGEGKNFYIYLFYKRGVNYLKKKKILLQNLRLSRFIIFWFLLDLSLPRLKN